jgi:predicted RNase H-like HicB family nuclease
MIMGSSKEPGMSEYKAIIQRDGKWWVGWIAEVPGVNSQGATRQELLDNLKSALEEALDMNRSEAKAQAKGAYEEASVQV